MTTAKLAVRVDEKNPDHHLWNNHGTWWCHFTVHLPCSIKQRLRLSLNTADLQRARSLRDDLLSRFNSPPELVLAPASARTGTGGGR